MNAQPPLAGGPFAGGAKASGLAVHVRGVKKSFGARTVLGKIDVDVRAGEFVALLGPSGTGKTTLLRILAGLEAADEGVVLVPKVKTTVYQEPRLVQSMRVLSNVTIGQPQNVRTRDAGSRALAEVGLADHADSWPATLSGGEAQRVALARALVREPALLLLDEPFAALDALTRLHMQSLIVRLFSTHRPAALLVTHDPDEAIRLADRILVLSAGHFSLDLAIDAPRGHRSDVAPTLACRRLLLDALGVVQDV